MGKAHRDKIKNSNILNALIEHVEGKREMSSSQVTAGLGLLKKVMPDLTHTDHTSDGKPVSFDRVALVPLVANDETDHAVH